MSNFRHSVRRNSEKWAAHYVAPTSELHVDEYFDTPNDSASKNAFKYALIRDPVGIMKEFAIRVPVPSLDWLKFFEEQRYTINELTWISPSYKYYKHDESRKYSIINRPYPADTQFTMCLGNNYRYFDQVLSYFISWITKHCDDERSFIWILNNAIDIHPELRFLLKQNLRNSECITPEIKMLWQLYADGKISEHYLSEASLPQNLEDANDYYQFLQSLEPHLEFDSDKDLLIFVIPIFENHDAKDFNKFALSTIINEIESSVRKTFKFLEFYEKLSEKKPRLCDLILHWDNLFVPIKYPTSSNRWREIIALLICSLDQLIEKNQIKKTKEKITQWLSDDLEILRRIAFYYLSKDELFSISEIWEIIVEPGLDIFAPKNQPIELLKLFDYRGEELRTYIEEIVIRQDNEKGCLILQKLKKISPLSPQAEELINKKYKTHQELREDYVQTNQSYRTENPINDEWNQIDNMETFAEFYERAKLDWYKFENSTWQRLCTKYFDFALSFLRSNKYDYSSLEWKELLYTAMNSNEKAEKLTIDLRKFTADQFRQHQLPLCSILSHLDVLVYSEIFIKACGAFTSSHGDEYLSSTHIPNFNSTNSLHLIKKVFETYLCGEFSKNTDFLNFWNALLWNDKLRRDSMFIIGYFYELFFNCDTFWTIRSIKRLLSVDKKLNWAFFNGYLERSKYLPPEKLCQSLTFISKDLLSMFSGELYPSARRNEFLSNLSLLLVAHADKTVMHEFSPVFSSITQQELWKIVVALSKFISQENSEFSEDESIESIGRKVLNFISFWQICIPADRHLISERVSFHLFKIALFSGIHFARFYKRTEFWINEFDARGSFIPQEINFAAKLFKNAQFVRTDKFALLVKRAHNLPDQFYKEFGLQPFDNL